MTKDKHLKMILWYYILVYVFGKLQLQNKICILLNRNMVYWWLDVPRLMNLMLKTKEKLLVTICEHQFKAITIKEYGEYYA